MAEFDYNPIAQYLTLTYQCPECGEMTTSDTLPVPSPNFYAERASDSQNEEDYEIVCTNCGATSQVSLYTRYDGGFGTIDIVDENHLTVEEDFDDNDFDEFDDFEFDEEVFKATGNEYETILNKLSILSASEKNTIHKLLYVNIIARMEAFLSDTLKKEVMKDDASKRKFTENFKDFEAVQIKLSEIYARADIHDTTIKNALSDLIYHNLPKIKPIFHDAIGVDLGNIQELMKAIQKRHHIIHRNGNDKEGNEITITEEDIKKLWKIVEGITLSIQEQLANKSSANS